MLQLPPTAGGSWNTGALFICWPKEEWSRGLFKADLPQVPAGLTTLGISFFPVSVTWVNSVPPQSQGEERQFMYRAETCWHPAAICPVTYVCQPGLENQLTFEPAAGGHPYAGLTCAVSHQQTWRSGSHGPQSLPPRWALLLPH